MILSDPLTIVFNDLQFLRYSEPVFINATNPQKSFGAKYNASGQFSFDKSIIVSFFLHDIRCLPFKISHEYYPTKTFFYILCVENIPNYIPYTGLIISWIGRA